MQHVHKAMLCILIGVLLNTTVFGGGGPQNVLLVVNDQSLDSLQIGRYYATQRGIPDRNICHVSIPPASVNLATNDFQTSVVARIHSHIAAHGLSNQIDYIVLVQDLPSRVNDSEGSTAVLFYGFKNAPTYWMGGCNLPTNTKSFYFQAERAFYHRDSYGGTNYYLATLLLADRLPRAVSNIDRCVAADSTAPTGTMYLHKSADIYRNIRYLRYDNFDFSAKLLSRFPAYVFGSAYPHSNILALCDGAPNYTSNFWNNVAFRKGSLADHLTSYGGRLLDPSTGQSTVLDWMKLGVAGSYGTVSEPCAYLEKFPDPLCLFWYARGFNLAESYWMSVANPHMGLFVGDPLTAPYAHSPNVQIFPTNTSIFSGVVTVEVTTVMASGLVQRVDMYVDDLFSQTLTNIPPKAGNRITLHVSTATYSYVVNNTDTLYSAVSGLANSVNASQRIVRATAFGDRLVLTWTNFGIPCGDVSYSVETDIGTADELTIHARTLTSNLVESSYFAREGISVSSLTSAGANTGDTVACLITLTNGVVVTNRIVASQGQSAPSILSALIASINSHPDLANTSGVAAVDYVPYSSSATAFLQARKPGPEGWNLYVNFRVTQAIPGSGLNTNDSFQDHFDDNDDVLTARGAVLFACGRETATARFVWNTTGLPNGPHRLHVVACEGSAAEVQGHAWLSVTVSNSSFRTMLISPTNGMNVTVSSNVFVDLAITNVTGTVTQMVLYAEGKAAAVWSAPPFTTNLNTRFYGVGSLTLQGEAFASSGERAMSEPTTINITMSPTIDTDGDGLFDVWEQQHYPTYWYNGTSDLDGDEINNTSEFIADTDPWSAASYFLVSEIVRETNNNIRLVFPSSTQRLYSVAFNDEFIHGDFDNWQFVDSSPFWGAGGDMSWTDNGSETPCHPSVATSRVYRVRVRLP